MFDPPARTDYRRLVAVHSGQCHTSAGVLRGRRVLDSFLRAQNPDVFKNTRFRSHREQAHFPAEQPASQPHPRIPPADADACGSSHFGRSSAQGPLRAGRLIQAPLMLPDVNRMRTSGDFSATVRAGLRVARPCLVVHARLAGPPTRVGFVVSKAVGNAVVRNRVKRRLRHSVRGFNFSSPQDPALNLHVVVRALPLAAQADYSVLNAELESAWRQAGSKLSRGGAEWARSRRQRNPGRERSKTSRSQPEAAGIGA